MLIWSSPALVLESDRKTSPAFSLIAVSYTHLDVYKRQVVVLYGGRVAESNSVNAIFAQPAHPYTHALIGCIAQTNQARGTLKGIPGTVPSVGDYASGCRYHPRCERAQAVCRSEIPALRQCGAGSVACHFPKDVQHLSLIHI